MPDVRPTNTNRRFWRLLPILLYPQSRLCVWQQIQIGKAGAADTRQRLQQIEERRQDLHNQVVQARKKRTNRVSSLARDSVQIERYDRRTEPA